MSEKLVATDLWVLQAQETISQQQATIDRLTEQRNKLLDVDTLAEIIRKVDGNHNLGAGALAEALIAEIEAGK